MNTVFYIAGLLVAAAVSVLVTHAPEFAVWPIFPTIVLVGGGLIASLMIGN